MHRAPFLPGARDRRTHHPATKTSKPGSGSLFGASIAAGTLILLSGACTEAVLSAFEGHWAATGACIVSAGLTLVFYGLAARRHHHREDRQARDAHEDAVPYLGDVDPEYRRHHSAFAAHPDKHTPAAKRDYEQMRATLHTRLAGRA